MKEQIKYESIEAYKYRITEEYHVSTGLKGNRGLGYVGDSQGGVQIMSDGLLIISKGFLSDGASGPTIDTEDSMRAAFVHDALYKLMREWILPQRLRRKVDKLFYKICREDGMAWFRAQYWYWGLRIGGASSAKPTKGE